MMKKVGLLLGSFNPVTVAHIAIASHIINSGLCDKVLFVVAKHNPWKKEEPAPFDLRCKMIEESIKPLGDKVEVCRFEEEFEPPVYSYLPIGKALEIYPDDELYIIAGTDTVERIPKWKNYETHIKGKVDVIEVTRGYNDLGTGFENKPEPFKVIDETVPRTYLRPHRGYDKLIKTLVTQRMDVSSTNVRWMIANGMNPYPYVTNEVLQIINENNLYKQ